jgi:hypothetical protein
MVAHPSISLWHVLLSCMTLIVCRASFGRLALAPLPLGERAGTHSDEFSEPHPKSRQNEPVAC